MTNSTNAPAGILLKRPGFYRQLRSANGAAWVFEPASIPYLTEELIARSAITIGIPASSPAVPFLHGLTPFLRQRIEVLDQDRQVNDRTGALLSPIIEALGGRLVTRAGPVTVVAIWIPTNVPEQFRMALGGLLPRLYDFLLGWRYHLHVDLDLQAVRSSIVLLRSVVKTPNARTTLAALQGILESYKPQEVPGVAIRSQACADQLRVFESFVQDESYQELSRNAGTLGSLSLTVGHIGDLMKRAAQAVVAKPIFAPFSRLVSKAISTATSVPLPDSEIAMSLLGQKYLPPIVSLADAIASAHAQWTQNRGPFVMLDEWREQLGAGDWAEVVAPRQPDEVDFVQRSNEIPQ